MALNSNKVVPLATTNVIDTTKGDLKIEIAKDPIENEAPVLPAKEEEYAPTLLKEEEKENSSPKKATTVKGITSEVLVKSKEGTVSRRGGFPFYLWHKRFISLRASNNPFSLHELRNVYHRKVVNIQGSKIEFEKSNSHLFDSLATATVDPSSFLTYYKEDDKSAPRELINLKEVVAIEPKLNIRRDAFSIVTKSKEEFILSTGSEEQSKLWIKELKERMTLNKPNVSNSEVFKSNYQHLVNRKGFQSASAVKKEASPTPQIEVEAIKNTKLEIPSGSKDSSANGADQTDGSRKSFSHEVMATLNSKLGAIDTNKGKRAEIPFDKDVESNPASAVSTQLNQTVLTAGTNTTSAPVTNNNTDIEHHDAVPEVENKDADVGSKSVEEQAQSTVDESVISETNDLVAEEAAKTADISTEAPKAEIAVVGNNDAVFETDLVQPAEITTEVVGSAEVKVDEPIQAPEETVEKVKESSPVALSQNNESEVKETTNTLEASTPANAQSGDDKNNATIVDEKIDSEIIETSQAELSTVLTNESSDTEPNRFSISSPKGKAELNSLSQILEQTTEDKTEVTIPAPEPKELVEEVVASIVKTEEKIDNVVVAIVEEKIEQSTLVEKVLPNGINTSNKEEIPEDITKDEKATEALANKQSDLEATINRVSSHVVDEKEAPEVPTKDVKTSEASNDEGQAPAVPSKVEEAPELPSKDQTVPAKEIPNIKNGKASVSSGKGKKKKKGKKH